MTLRYAHNDGNASIPSDTWLKEPGDKSTFEKAAHTSTISTTFEKGGSRCAREELSGASSQKGLLMTPSKQVKAKIEAVEPVPLPAAKRPAMAAILMGALLPEGGPL